MKTLKFFFPVLLLSLFFFNVNAQGVISNQTVPVSFQFPLCGTDIVQVEGKMHVVYKETKNYDEYKFNFSLKGVGLITGHEYVYQRVFHRKTHTQGDRAGYNQTWMIQSHVIGKGNAPDFDLRWLVHVTFNAANEMNIVWKQDLGCSD